MKAHRSMAVLEVSDIEKSVDWYADNLGFVGGPIHGDPPAFCIVGRDAVTIALDQSRDKGRAPRNQYWAVYVYIDDVDAYREELRARGVEIVREPEDTFYGCRDFDVRDPDGHLICFGQDLRPGPDGPGL